MKKCGLRKAYALGGELGEMNPIELAQFTNNPEVLNAASTRKWTLDEAERQAKYGAQSFATPVSKLDIAKAHRGLNTALLQNNMIAPQPPQLKKPAQDPFKLPSLEQSQPQPFGFAQGGTIDPDALMREMAAKYGTSGAQPQVAAPAPQPAPAPVPVQAPQPKPTLLQGLRRLATGGIEDRMKAAGFKQGGTVDGKGYIHGEKGVDKVPAKVAETGEDILVSDGERIVNKRQNAALERLAAEAGMSLDEYLERSTGEPVGPQMKQGLRAAEQGWNRVHMPGDRVSVDFNPVKPKPDLVKPVEQDPFAFRGGDRGVPGPSNGPDSTALTPAPTVAKPVAPTSAKTVTSPSIDSRTPAEQAAAGAQAGLEAKGLRNAMQFLGGEGAAVPEGMRVSRQTESNAPLSTWNSKHDVAAQSINNRITPENGTGIVTMKNKDGTFKNVVIGQAEYTGADGKPTSDWSKTQQYADGVAQAQKTKDSLARIQRERAEFAAFDPSITDPVARQNGLRQVAMYMMQDEAAGKALQHKEDRDAMLGLRRDMLEEQKRQFDVTLQAGANAAKDSQQKSRIADLDKLIADQGVEDKNDYRDFMRENFFGRRLNIEGEEVDVPGMEDMPADQMRALMPHALTMYMTNKALNQGSENGTSRKAMKKAHLRDANYTDVEKNAFGIPSIFSADNPNKMSLIGKNSLLASKMPKGLRDQDYTVVEEILEDGSAGRRALRKNMPAQQYDLDVAAYLNSLK